MRWIISCEKNIRLFINRLLKTISKNFIVRKKLTILVQFLKQNGSLRDSILLKHGK